MVVLNFYGKIEPICISEKLGLYIAHGDFLAFETVIETYASEFMDGRFAFDYSEYSRKNWAVQHVCCELDNVIRKLLGMLLFNRRELERIKKSI